MLATGRQRIEAVKALKIFNEQIFFDEVFLPILNDLGIQRTELRRRTRREYVKLDAPAPDDGPKLKRSA
jgi:hypothetical protein